MRKNNLVIVQVTRRGGCVHGAQIVRVPSQEVLGDFHGHHGDLVAVQERLRLQLEDLYPTALRMAVYHPGRREEPYLSSSQLGLGGGGGARVHWKRGGGDGC